ncbi:MAG: hypothetical protein HY080_14415 [Gammaproteobacteria bacterium]|nr:hypothetical protein [Gammaproteobacteria bacterium]
MHSIESSMQNLHRHASKRTGSCLAACQSLASDIFIETGLRPDLYSLGSYHYHLRINSFDIVDPSVAQFFNLPAEITPKVFIGTLQQLTAYLAEMFGSYGFNPQHLYILTSKPKSPDDLYKLWALAALNTSGERLKKITTLKTGREKAWYE